MADSLENINRFKPAMPRIPGVSEPQTPQENAAGAPRRSPLRILVPLAAACAVGAAMGWWMLRALHRVPTAPGAAARSASAASGAAVVPPNGPAAVATLEELAKPWSAKQFRFRKRFTNETLPALLVRLPGGAAKRSGTYWAFSLQAPFKTCELEYVTDLGKLAEQYSYRALHPMVADPCSGTVYDPLRFGTLPGGAWARGEVVQGPGMRPPIAIEVRVQGNHLIAAQIE